MKVRLTSNHPYKASLGELKVHLDNHRDASKLLVLDVEPLSTDAFAVFIDPFNLWLVAVAPNNSDAHYFADATHYPVPEGFTRKRLPFGGRHMDLGTRTHKFQFDDFQNLGADVAGLAGGSHPSTDRLRKAMSLLVVAVSEASRFRTILIDMSEVLSKRKTVKGIDLEAYYNNWSARSGCEGKYPEVRIHHRSGKSPCTC